MRCVLEPVDPSREVQDRIVQNVHDAVVGVAQIHVDGPVVHLDVDHGETALVLIHRDRAGGRRLGFLDFQAHAVPAFRQRVLVDAAEEDRSVLD